MLPATARSISWNPENAPRAGKPDIVPDDIAVYGAASIKVIIHPCA
jgi:hypothetical protein